jgi:hypothetical protein
MRWIALVGMVVCAAPYTAWGGDLGRAKDEVRKDDDEKDDDRGKDKRHDDHDRDRDRERHDRGDHDRRREHDGDDGDDITSTFALLVLGSPFWVPHLAVGDDLEVPSAFAAYPYEGGLKGLVLRGAQAQGRAPAAGSIGVTGGWRPGGLWTGKADAQLMTSSRFGASTTWYHFVEPQAGKAADTLTAGDVQVTLRFAQNERISFWTGLGARFMPDAELHAGFIIAYGVDVFPVDPLTISARVDGGSLGHAGVGGVSVRAGVMLGAVDVGVGWDLLGIGTVSLTALTLGVRLWL